MSIAKSVMNCPLFGDVPTAQSMDRYKRPTLACVTRGSLALRWLSLEALLVLLCAACSTAAIHEALPRIHSIGTRHVLTYVAGHDLDIPIDGLGLDATNLKWAVRMEGVAPLIEGVDFELHTPSQWHAPVPSARPGLPATDSAPTTSSRESTTDGRNVVGTWDASRTCFIRVLGRYFGSVRSGDTLTISITVTERPLTVTGNPAEALTELTVARLARLRTSENWVAFEVLAEIDNVIHAAKTLQRSFSDQSFGSWIATTTISGQERDTVQQRLLSLAEGLEIDGAAAAAASCHGLLTAELRQLESRPTAPEQSSKAKKYSEFDLSVAALERNMTKWIEPLRAMTSMLTEMSRLSPIEDAIAFATRRITLYESEVYRTSFLNSHVAAPDIAAFPLPFAEASSLFGGDVADAYFVVRLSLRNRTDKDQLISTGMIRAYGSAVASATTGRRKGVQTVAVPFTFPVEVVPQSREHVYAFVSDRKADSVRERGFRVLTFAGALATGITTGFDYSKDATTIVAMFTGTGIPGLSALWPDPIPAYLANIVNFSMPDLIRVPRAGVSAHKYLFFSKKDLQGTISDPLLYITDTGKVPLKLELPDAKVAYLAFDSLEIPFDNVESERDAGSVASKPTSSR